MQLGDDMSLELNSLALGLDNILTDNGNSYVVDTVECYNSFSEANVITSTT